MSDTSDQLRRLDDTIAADRALYLRAVWAGHDGEAQWWEVEVDRLLSLRTVLQRGPLTEHLTEHRIGETP